MAEDESKPGDPRSEPPAVHPLPPRAETAAETEKQPEVHHPDGRMEHPWVEYEKRDARFPQVAIVMVVIGVVGALQAYAVLCFFRGQEHSQAEQKKSPYPLAPDSSTQAPLEPRLEQIDRLKGVARENVYRRELAKELVLHSYGETADDGFVHIAIEQAMEAVAGELKVRDEPAGPHHDRGLIDSGESNSGRLFRREPRW